MVYMLYISFVTINGKKEYIYIEVLKGGTALLNIHNIKISVVVAILGTSLTWLFGAWDGTLKVLITIIALDYVTDIIQAYVNKSIHSAYGLKCIAKKSTIFIVLILGVLLDRAINSENWMFRTLVSYFYIANEGVSILENCGKMGLKIPGRLKNALVQLRDDSDSDQNNKEELIVKKENEPTEK